MIEMIEPKNSMRGRLEYLLMDSEIDFAAFLLGFGLVIWGGVALFKSPADLLTFAGHMADNMLPPGAWVANYVGAGIALMWVAYKGLPPFPSLLVGTYLVLVWSWIAQVRSQYSNLTSGVTLNIFVILIGALIIQRSGRKRNSVNGPDH